MHDSPRASRWVLRAAAAIVVLAVAAIAATAGSGGTHAQGSAAHQSGTVVPGHLAKLLTNGRVGDAGGIAGDANGVGLEPFAVNDKLGLGVCSNSAATTGPHNQLCLGHDSSSNGLMTLDSYGGLPGKALKIRINGTLYDFPGAGSGNVVMWNGGTTVRDGGQDVAMAADKAALALTPTSAHPLGLWRLDNAAGVGAPPLFYLPQPGTCASNGAANDGGGCIDTTAGDGNSWIARPDAAGIDFRQWGPKPGVAVDDELDAAIAYACRTHVPIRFQYLGTVEANAYRLGRAHLIGNGSSTANSTCNGVTFIGDPHYTEYAMNQGVMFQWYGPAGGTIPITVRGPMQNVVMRGIAVDCRNTCATGIKIVNTLDSRFAFLGVRRNIGPAFIFTSEPVNVWFGGFEGSHVHDISAAFPGPGGSGAVIGDSACNPCQSPVIANLFENNSFLFDGNTPETYGLKLGFTVQNTFVRSRIQRVCGGDCTGPTGDEGNSFVIAPPPGAPGTPDDATFYHITATGPVLEGAGWAPTSGIRFDGWAQWAEPFPRSTIFGKIWGTDLTGKYYPGVTDWTLTDTSGATGGPLALEVSDTKFFKLGNVCSVSFAVKWPSTLDTHNAQIGGLPPACAPRAATKSVAGSTPSFSTVGSPVFIAAGPDGHGGAVMDFYNDLGRPYTNAGLSRKELRASASWITD